MPDEVKRMEVENPLILVFEDEDKRAVCHLYPGKKEYRHYGILIADVVRHVALCFNVNVNQVREWVDKELDDPTSPIYSIKPN